MLILLLFVSIEDLFDRVFFPASILNGFDYERELRRKDLFIVMFIVLLVQP